MIVIWKTKPDVKLSYDSHETEKQDRTHIDADWF